MFNFLRKKIGIIGFGNMGSVIFNRIKNQYPVAVFDQDNRKTQTLSSSQRAASGKDLADQSDVIILAVKPQDFEVLLNEIKDLVRDKLIISIAAGITTERLEKTLGKVRIVRAMPNLPARIGEGVICLSPGKYAVRRDCGLSKKIFSRLGKTFEIPERLMHDVTAVAGSGPAFFYDLYEKQVIPGRKDVKQLKEEFDETVTRYLESQRQWERTMALAVASATSAGSLALLEVSEGGPQSLILQIASKGGTTQAGLEKLHEKGTLEAAFDAAIQRSEALSSY